VLTPPMAYTYDMNHQARIDNLVENSVVAHAYPIDRLLARERFATARSLIQIHGVLRCF